MADPTTSSPAEYRLRWTRGGYALAEVERPRVGDAADADLVAADGAEPAGTLQTFADTTGALRGRLSLREPIEFQLTFVHPRRLHQATVGAGAGAVAVDARAHARAVEAAPTTPSTGRPSRVAVVAEFSEPLHFLRFAISGVTAPIVTKFSDTAVTMALAAGEYFYELRPALTPTEAAAPRPLNRRTHHTARSSIGESKSGPKSPR